MFANEKEPPRFKQLNWRAVVLIAAIGRTRLRYNSTMFAVRSYSISAMNPPELGPSWKQRSQNAKSCVQTVTRFVPTNDG